MGTVCTPSSIFDFAALFSGSERFDWLECFECAD